MTNKIAFLVPLFLCACPPPTPAMDPGEGSSSTGFQSTSTTGGGTPTSGDPWETTSTLPASTTTSGASTSEAETESPGLTTSTTNPNPSTTGSSTTDGMASSEGSSTSTGEPLENTSTSSSSSGSLEDSSSSSGEPPPDPFCGDKNVDEGEGCDDGNDIVKDGCEPDCTETPGGGCEPPGPGDLWFNFNWSSVVKVKQPKYTNQGQVGLFSWQPGNMDGSFPIVVGTPVANMGGAPFWGNTVWVLNPNEITIAFGLWNLLDFSSASFCMEGASGAIMEEIQIDMLDGPCGAGVAKIPWVWGTKNQKEYRQVSEVDITDCVDPDKWESITFRPGAKMLLQQLTVVIRDPVVVPKP